MKHCYDYEKILELRNQGFPFTQITKMLGYKNSKKLNSAFNVHYKRHAGYQPQRIHYKSKVLTEKLIPNYKTNTIEVQQVWI